MNPWNTAGLVLALLGLSGCAGGTAAHESTDPVPLPVTARAVLDTIREIDPYPAYTMSYPADYRLEEALARGLASDAEIRQFVGRIFGLALTAGGSLLPQGKHCTGFSAASSSGDQYQGHNEDWTQSDYLVLRTSPGDGIPSVSLVDIGFAREYSTGDRRGFLLAPYVPLAGMNQAGLVVATYSIPRCRPPVDPAKKKLLWSVVLRLLLDRAATLEEALRLIDTVNVVIEPQNDLQFFVGDARGDSAVVEWIDGRTVAVRKTGRWQGVTNFIQYGATEADFAACDRYQTVKRLLESAGGLVTDGLGVEILKQSSQPRYTQFSVLFNQTRGSLQVFFGRHYDTGHDF